MDIVRKTTCEKWRETVKEKRNGIKTGESREVRSKN